MSQFGTSTRPFMSAIFRYGLAVLSVAAALFIRELLRTYFEPTPNSFFLVIDRGRTARTQVCGSFLGDGLARFVSAVGLL